MTKDLYFPMAYYYRILSNFLLLSAWIWVACSPPSKETEVVNRSGEHFMSFQEFPYTALKLGNVQKQEITLKSNAFDFSEGKSYFLSYELPYNQAYSLIVSSYMMGESIHRASIFYPTIVFLNSDYTVVYAEDSLEFKKAWINETWGVPYKYEFSKEFNAGENNPRYMIIYTTPQHREWHTSVKNMRVIPIVMPEYVGAIPSGSEEVFIRHSSVGRVRVLLTDTHKQ